MKKRNQSQVIEVAINYDMAKVVKRYMRDYDVPESIARQHEIELKRYLLLCALHPFANYGMRGPVDNLWHVFIFHTKEYFDFCKKISRGYIHHIPEDPDDHEKKAGGNTYKAMLDAYRVTFNSAPPFDIWPKLKKPKGQTGEESSMDACNSGSCANNCNSHCGGSCSSCGSGCNSCNGGCGGCDHCGSD